MVKFVVLTGKTEAVNQAISELQSNIEYEKLKVKVTEVKVKRVA